MAMGLTVPKDRSMAVDFSLAMVIYINLAMAMGLYERTVAMAMGHYLAKAMAMGLFEFYH